MKRMYVWVAAVSIVLGFAAIVIRMRDRTVMNTTTPKESAVPVQSRVPDMTIDTGKQYTAVLETSAGTITVSLTAKETPKTVNNFVYLVRSGFYNNTPFHRVISGFMIQGGDPEGTGRGGPGYRFDDEPFTGEYTRGTIAMANAGPNTNGSQFFIMHADYKLPHDYVIFGHVTDGMSAVDAIASAPTVQDGRENSRPVTPVIINTATIIER